MQKIWHNIPSDDKKIRDFGWVIFVVVGLIIPAFLSWKQEWTLPESALFLWSGGGLFLGLTIFAKSLMRPVFKAWMLLALGMGFVMTRVIVTLVYLLMITPVGAVRRWNKGSLPRHFLEFRKSDQNSFWIQRTDTYSPEKSETQY